MTLAHDITEIIPGKKKDVAFTKGTVIEAADVEKLLDLGKRHLYVFDGDIEGIHEDDAGKRIAQAIMGKHMERRSERGQSHDQKYGRWLI